MRARVLTIDQVVIEEVYSQAEKRSRPAPVLYFRETKKGLVLSGPNQDALQVLFGDDVAACFGAKVLLEPTPMRVAGRELVVIRLKSAAASNSTGPKTRGDEKLSLLGTSADCGGEPQPESKLSG